MLMSKLTIPKKHRAKFLLICENADAAATFVINKQLQHSVRIFWLETKVSLLCWNFRNWRLRDNRATHNF